MTHGSLWRALPPALGMVMVCLACGSGSSGFRPRDVELSVIQSSAATGMCATAPGGLEVCARTAAEGEGAVCDGAGSGCSFVVAITLHDVAPGTSVIGAVEPQDLSGIWRTSSNVVGPADEAGELRGQLAFVTKIAAGSIALRAILIYPPGVSVPPLGADGIDVDLLADLRSSRADVLVDWPIEPPE